MGLFDEYQVPVTHEMSETLSGDLLEEVPAPFPKQYYPLAHLKERYALASWDVRVLLHRGLNICFLIEIDWRASLLKF